MNTKINTLSPCGGCHYSRRAFLAGCVGAGCLGTIGALSGFSFPDILADSASVANPKSRMKVRVVFALHAPVQPGPDWPNVGFDFNPVMENTMKALKAGCQGIDFVQSMSNGPEETEKLIATDQAEGNIDGYIVVQSNCWNQVMQRLVGTGKPVLYADFLYAGSGGFLVYTAGQLRAQKENFAFISSGNMNHLVATANCLPLAMGSGGMKAFVDGVAKVRKDIAAGVKVDMKCTKDKVDVLSTADLLKELKTKKILEYEKGWLSANHSLTREDTLGVEILQRPFSELNDIWEKIDRDQSMEIVKRWKRTAKSIIDVSDETLEESARMYLAQKECLKKHDACAITINCLGGFYGGHIQAYPCLGFHELLNEGLIGACECDTMSTLTMVVMTTLTKGRPGYISDPVMDVATKQIIYAHCVAPNKPFGPKGASNPFAIMTHSEDRQGASLRSTLPVGYMTTSVKMDPIRKEILFHQAKAVANSADDRACRTKLQAVPVGDFEKLYSEWDHWGWHRITYYGDLKEPVFALADALGWKVLQEA